MPYRIGPLSGRNSRRAVAATRPSAYLKGEGNAVAVMNYEVKDVAINLTLNVDTMDGSRGKS